MIIAIVMLAVAQRTISWTGSFISQQATKPATTLLPQPPPALPPGGRNTPLEATALVAPPFFCHEATNLRWLVVPYQRPLDPIKKGVSFDVSGTLGAP